MQSFLWILLIRCYCIALLSIFCRVEFVSCLFSPLFFLGPYFLFIVWYCFFVTQNMLFFLPFSPSYHGLLGWQFALMATFFFAFFFLSSRSIRICPLWVPLSCLTPSVFVIFSYLMPAGVLADIPICLFYPFFQSLYSLSLLPSSLSTLLLTPCDRTSCLAYEGHFCARFSIAVGSTRYLYVATTISSHRREISNFRENGS